MILNSVEIDNIRSYNHEKIEFPRGITLFEGDIGSGKSTVLMAIEFALFGLGSQKPDSLLSKKESDGYVVLNFEVDGKTYEIKRKLKRKGDSISQDSKSCHLISEGEIEPLSASELKQRILQILRFNEPASANSESRIYRYAVFTPQEEMKTVLSDSKKRLETIRKAFGMEDYKIAAENAKNMLTSLKVKIAESKSGFSNLEDLKKELQGVTNEHKEEKTIILQLKRKLPSLEKMKIKTQQIIEKISLEQKEKEKNEIKKENMEKNLQQTKSLLKSNSKKIQDKEDEILDNEKTISIFTKSAKPTQKSLSELDKMIEYFENLNGELMSINSEIQTVEKDLSKLSTQLGTYRNSTLELLQEELTESISMVNQLTAKHEEINTSIVDIEKSNAVLENRKNELELKFNNISKLGSKCFVCDNILTDDHIKNLKKEYQKNLDEIKNNIDLGNQLITEKLASKNTLAKQIEKARSTTSRIQPLLSIIQQWNEKNFHVTELKSKLEKLDKKRIIPEEKSFPNHAKFKDPLSYVKALRDALIEFNDTEKQIEQKQIAQQKLKQDLIQLRKEKESISKQISEFESSLETIIKKLNSLNDVDAKLKSAKTDEKNIQNNIDTLRHNLSTKEENLRHLKNQINKFNKDILDAKNAEKKYRIFIDISNWLKDFFIPTLEQIEKQVLRSIQHNFNSIYQNWFSILIEDPTKQSRIDEDFTPLVEQDGYEQNTEYLSGGEKTSIALSYRLTLNSMIRQETGTLKSNLLILDEPTDGFSKTQLSKVRTVLQQLKSQQIILVSHEKELETYVDNIFYISKDDGSSHVYRRNN